MKTSPIYLVAASSRIGYAGDELKARLVSRLHEYSAGAFTSAEDIQRAACIEFGSAELGADACAARRIDAINSAQLVACPSRRHH